MKIAALLAQSHTRVTHTLREQRARLDALASLLLKQETVERAALDALLKGALPAAR